MSGETYATVSKAELDACEARAHLLELELEHARSEVVRLRGDRRILSTLRRLDRKVSR